MGKLSAHQVQEYAERSSAQGATGVDSIASAGTNGQYGSSIHRKLMKLFGRPRGAPEIDWIEIPVKGGRRIAHPFIFPHNFFEAIFKERYDVFCRAIRGTEGAIAEYWHELRDTEFVRQHPLLRDKAHAIPIGVHGDAGPYSKQDSLLTISWNGLLGGGTTRTKRFVFTFVRKADYTAETLDRIFTLLSWSMNSMASGRHPELDWDNRHIPNPSKAALAGEYTGVLTQIRGDWQFYCEIFQFPPWNGAVRMCWLCRASGAIRRLGFTDCSEQAGWRGTCWTDETWRAHLKGLGYAIPILLLLVVGLRLECITIDALHSIDLGFASHVVGNTFWETIRRHAWSPGDQDANAAALDKAMVAHCKDTNVPSRVQGQLSKERIRSTSDSGYPKLKAKGAQTRHLAPFSLEVAKRFQRHEPHPMARHDAIVVAVNALLCKLYRLMATSSQFFTDEAKRQIVEIGNQLPQLYQQLYTEAARAGVKAWKMTPKVHLVQHLLIYHAMLWGNPAYYWCYCDEDLVGLVVEIAQSCHATTVCATALVKWLVLCFDCDPEDE